MHVKVVATLISYGKGNRDCLVRIGGSLCSEGISKRCNSWFAVCTNVFESCHLIYC